MSLPEELRKISTATRAERTKYIATNFEEYLSLGRRLLKTFQREIKRAAEDDGHNFTTCIISLQSLTRNEQMLLRKLGPGNQFITEGFKISYENEGAVAKKIFFNWEE